MRGDKIYLMAKSLHDKMYARANQLKGEQKIKLYTEYLNLIRRAAYLGHPHAQYDLGQQYEDMNYLHIKNPAYNPKKSFFWYTKSCEQNHAEACNNLASLYEKGEGCKKDLKKALALYKKSGDLGYAIGKDNYKIMLRRMKKVSGR